MTKHRRDSELFFSRYYWKKHMKKDGVMDYVKCIGDLHIKKGFVGNYERKAPI
jgi:hypothetical protein